MAWTRPAPPTAATAPPRSPRPGGRRRASAGAPATPGGARRVPLNMRTTPGAALVALAETRRQVPSTRRSPGAAGAAVVDMFRAHSNSRNTAGATWVAPAAPASRRQNFWLRQRAGLWSFAWCRTCGASFCRRSWNACWCRPCRAVTATNRSYRLTAATVQLRGGHCAHAWGPHSASLPRLKASYAWLSEMQYPKFGICASFATMAFRAGCDLEGRLHVAAGHLPRCTTV
mmetsp:Transcript_21542/g.67230  ORF Transcript_21542/g.67230 Transcript_21542/m.67230 type:complete len:230 (+) Transcript_21542:601-1290(+)